MVHGTDEGRNSFPIVLGTGDIHKVAHVHYGVAIRYGHVTVMQEARANEVTAKEIANLKYSTTIECLVLGTKRHAMRLGVRVPIEFPLYLLGLLLKADTADITNGYRCSDDSHYAKRISTSIS